MDYRCLGAVRRRRGNGQGSAPRDLDVVVPVPRGVPGGSVSGPGTRRRRSQRPLHEARCDVRRDRRARRFGGPRSRRPGRGRHRGRRRRAGARLLGQRAWHGPGRGRQPRAVVGVVGMGLRHERHGHGPGDPRADAGQGTGALVRGLPRVDLRGRGRAGRRHRRPARRAQHLVPGRLAARLGAALAAVGRRVRTGQAAAAGAAERDLAGRRLRRGQAACRDRARRR